MTILINIKVEAVSNFLKNCYQINKKNKPLENVAIMRNIAINHRK